MSVRSGTGLMLCAVLAAAAGCAPMATTPAKPTGASAPPASAAHAAVTPADSLASLKPTGTAIDTTTPSPAAQHVLATIPEPLTPAQQALSPAPDTSRARGIVALAPAAAYDSLQAAPVPAATQVLGTETSTVGVDTTSSPASPTLASAPAAAATGAATTSGAAASGASAAGGAAAGAATGSGAAAAGGGAAVAGAAPASGACWRLQVGAPLESEKEKADGRVEAAQSLLMVPFTIVPEKGYLKVRTRDCMTRETADALKKRAVDSGFNDAFLIDTNATQAAPKHQTVPKSKRKI